jgi:hypothetical protein
MQRAFHSVLTIALALSVSTVLSAQGSLANLAADIRGLGNEFNFATSVNTGPNYSRWQSTARVTGACTIALTLTVTHAVGDVDAGRSGHSASRALSVETTEMQIDLRDFERALPQHWNITYPDGSQKRASRINVVMRGDVQQESTKTFDQQYWGVGGVYEGKERMEDERHSRSSQYLPEIRTGESDRGAEQLAASFERAAQDCGRTR